MARDGQGRVARHVASHGLWGSVRRDGRWSALIAVAASPPTACSACPTCVPTAPPGGRGGAVLSVRPHVPCARVCRHLARWHLGPPAPNH